MSYVVLARKWRPMRFEDLVGQDHVARTLGNAIDAGRVAHAFLFTGVRGVGKTTSARILAKALNCMRKPGSLNPGDPDPGPTVTPCLECSACLEIAEGTDLDVREIDGASYNGVDEVRKLQDSLPYRPSRDRYKVVIVDEVHMLSQAAWNAFLKTLEEPPPHVKFIFATTEVHKVPITILSRVQRFDFKMIPTRLIVQRLRWVLEQENSSADDVALGILARQAAGSMRDAMSLLDQVIAFGGETLSGDDVARVLGVASRKALVDIGRAVVQGDSEACLGIVGSLADQGFDIPHVTKDVLHLLRDLVVAKVCRDPGQLLDLSDEEKTDILAIAAETHETDLLRLHQAFSKGYDDVVRGADPRAGLEMLLVRLALRPPLLPVDELLHRIGNLEKRLVQGGASPQPRGRPSGGSGGTPPPQGATANPNRRPRDRAPTTSATKGPPQPSGSDDDVPDAPSVNEAPSSSSDNVLPARIQPTPEQALERTAPSVERTAPVEQTAPIERTAPVERTAPREIDSYRPSDQEQQLITVTMEVSDIVREQDKELAAYLDQTVPLSREGNLLRLGLEKGNLFERQITSEKAVAVYAEALQRAWGADARIELVQNCKDATHSRTLSAARARKRRAEELMAIEAVKQHPRVREAVEIFRAQVKSVSVPEFNS